MDPNQNAGGGDPYFADAEGAADPGGSPKEESSETDSATSLLPTSFFGGKAVEPGYRCEVEVVRVHDDQVEVKTCSESSGESEPTLTKSESAPMPDDMMG